MSSITTDQGIVHYEVHGRGKPVILLHGWLGSWGLWQETMAHLGTNNRTYALDFWGFGESGKKRETYDIADFVSLVEQFMEQLGIMRAPVIGHSMGGTVALSFAIAHPERVTKVGVIGSPIKGDSLSFLLKLAGQETIANIVFNMLWALKLGIRVAAPLITRDSRWPKMIEADLEQTTLESFFASINSLHKTDLREQLKEIQVPIMGIYGKRDVIVSSNQWKLVEEFANEPIIHFLKTAGHFVMLDEPKMFLDIMEEFVKIPPKEKLPETPEPPKPEPVIEDPPKPKKPSAIV